jgi:hypothetical protein
MNIKLTTFKLLYQKITKLIFFIRRTAADVVAFFLLCFCLELKSGYMMTISVHDKKYGVK